MQKGGWCELGLRGGGKALPGMIPVVWAQQQDKKSGPSWRGSPAERRYQFRVLGVLVLGSCETLKRRHQVSSNPCGPRRSGDTGERLVCLWSLMAGHCGLGS